MRIAGPRFVRGRAELLVRLRPDEPRRTTPEIAERVLAVLPGLTQHRCRNGVGLTFAEEAGNTEVAHLFEHIVLEIMVRAGSAGLLEGETTWDAARDGRGVFAVSVPCDDRRRCRSAIRLARRVLRQAVRGGAMPDVERAIGRIQKRTAAAKV